MGWQTQTASTQVTLATSDTAPLVNGTAKAFYVTAAGTVSWTDNANPPNTNTLTLAAGQYPFEITKLLTVTTVPVLGLY